MEKTPDFYTATSIVMADSGSVAPESSYGNFPVSLPPLDVSALYQRALALQRGNRFNEAESLYRQVLEIEPGHPSALHFLGMIALLQKNLPEALRLIESSLAKCSTKPVFFNNYGVALKEAGRFEEAKDAFEKALAMRPNYPDALSNLGFVSLILRQPENQSEHYLKSALLIQPGHRDALQHLSELRLRQERHCEAFHLLKQHHAQVAENAELEHRMGCLCGDAGDWKGAERYFQKAASLPGGKTAWKWKHLWYCPIFFENENDIDQYWQSLNEDLDTAIAEKPLYDWRSLPYDGFTHSFQLPHHNRCYREVLEKFTKLFAPSFPFERPTYKPGKKIRVGFLVTPGHEGGFIRLTSGLIDRLDPEKFEVVLIYNEATQERFKGKFRRPDLREVRFTWNFEESVRTIRHAKCDIIYYWKVGADVWNFFLPMCRLAPVQVTSWGTHGTSGVEHVDYYVSWDKAEIPDAQKHYTEKLVLLNTSPLYEPFLHDLPSKATRKELNLPETGAIYFCPHRLPKYHPIFDDYLRQILEHDPTGHIVLFLGRPSLLTQKFMKRMRSAIGEASFKRIIILPLQNVRQYYRYLSVATVLLNSPIYSGEITAVDGFLYGIPCVSQTGELLIQRYSTAFYETFGLAELAPPGKEKYVEQAVKLGTNPDYHEAVCQKITERKKRLFENQQTIREWESFLSKAVVAPQRVADAEKKDQQYSGENNEQLFQQLALEYPWPLEKPSVPPNQQGWCDEPNQKMLSGLLDESTKIVIELGSWLGSSSRFILEHAPHAKIFCVDHWFGSQEHQESENEFIRTQLPTLFETYLVNLWDYRSRIVPLRTDSTRGLREVYRFGIKPDLIYIDASHDYQNVFDDVKTALDLFPGSMICGDDWHYDDVRKAVGELAREYGKQIVTEGNRVWRFEKETPPVSKTNSKTTASCQRQKNSFYPSRAKSDLAAS